MAAGGFDYSEFIELAQRVKKMEQGSVQFIEKFLLEMALRALRNIIKRTPTSTGDLKNKWYLSGVARRGNDVTISIINPALYASFVEYGHWQEVGRFVPGHWEPGVEKDRFVYEQGAKSGMVLKNPWVEGHYMLSVSIQEIEREMPGRLSAAWKRYAKAMLGGD